MPKELFLFCHSVINENHWHIPMQRKEIQGAFCFSEFVLLLNKFLEEISIEIAYKLRVKIQSIFVFMFGHKNTQRKPCRIYFSLETSTVAFKMCQL